MEVAITPAYHQQEFPRQISAMDAAVCIIDRLVEASLKRFDYAETRKYTVPKRIVVMDRYFSASPDEYAWVPAVKGSGFIRSGTVKKSMDPSLSIRKKIMQYNGRIVVADKIDTLLCFEYMPKGNLGKYLSDEYHELDWQTRFNIVKGICTILAYLLGQLKHRICHLDLKPANILLDCNMVAKITDFGLSMCLREERTRFNISMRTNGIVKYNGRIVLADMIDWLLCYEYIQNGDEYHGLDWPTCFNIVKGIRTGLAYLHEGFCHIDLKPDNILLDVNMVPKIADEKHGSAIPPSCFGKEARKMRSCGFGDDGGDEGCCGEGARKMRSCGFGDDDGGSKFGEEIKEERSTVLAHLMLLLMVQAVCYKISEMSPEEFFATVVYEIQRNRWMFESSSKQIKRLNQIVLSCLETGKSTKATSSTFSSTQRAAHHILILDSRAAPNMDSVDLVLDSNGLDSLQQHIFRNNLTDEQSVKPRSNRAAATNSSDETTRAPMANKLTDDEAENHSDPNSCVAERDTIEEEKRSGEWFVATGAAHHATWNRDLFSNLVDVENDGLCVHAADGTPMPVIGRGDVVTDDVVLPDVYYVPRLCTNLVSVGQLAGLDYCVGFGRGACVISSAAGTVVGRAHARGDGLYEVDCLRVTLGMP